jgi:hypothetical protein
MKHALIGYDTLGEEAFKNDLWIDGTSDDGTYQGDAVKGPWVVFDILKQENISGPFKSPNKARRALIMAIQVKNK